MIVTQRTRALGKALSVLLLTFVLVLAGPRQARAQAMGSDQAEILQKVVDLSGLQEYYPRSAQGTVKPLLVMQHAVSFPAGISVAHDGSPLVFLSKEQLKGGQQEAYFYFNEFRIDGTEAQVECTFYYDQNAAAPKMQVVSLQLHKATGGWAISQSKIDAR